MTGETLVDGQLARMLTSLTSTKAPSAVGRRHPTHRAQLGV
jgi:hypothetical protein